MTPERWQAVKALFDQACARPVDERAAWLAAAVPDDSEMQREVATLLAAEEAADAATGDFLEAPPSTYAGDALQSRFAGIPERIGPYLVGRELGRGGMGVVFLASRDDEAYEKEVAIKLLQPGFGDDLLRRFRHERQILANLDHPNIAKLLDAGATEQGIPYLVMDYIDGEPLTEYCDKHRLTLAQRLSLFQIVCAAVHHAHRNLIVHRDLKPANILITRDGVPKLLDFGIAKLLAADAVRPVQTLTVVGIHPMTPGYASPEQIRGEAVTTATDTHALGVILYELLCGARPYAMESMSRSEIEQAVLSGTPTRPSIQALKCGIEAAERRGATPNRLRRALSGDLDNIVLTAVRKEAERRYGSASALSDDIRRYLGHFPITARTDTVRYRASRFVRRNKGIVAVVTLAAVCLSGAAAFATMQAQRAQRRFEEARQFSMSLLNDVYLTGDQGAAKVRVESAQRTLKYLEALAAESEGDFQVQEEIADAYMLLGVFSGDPLHTSLGNTSSALDAFRKSSALLERIVALKPTNKRLLALADAYMGIALALLPGDVEASLQAHRQELATRERLGATLANDVNSQVDLAGAIRLAGERFGHPYYGNIGDTASALREIDRALKLYEGLSPKVEPADTRRNFQLAACEAAMAGMQWAIGEIDNAILLQGRAIARYEELIRHSPDHTPFRTELGLLHVRLANLLYEQNRGTEAMTSLRNALQILEPLAAADPDNSSFHRNLTRAYNQLGTVSAAMDPRSSLNHYRKALDLGEAWIGRQSTDPEARERIAESHSGFARALAATGAGGEADEHSRKAVEIAGSLVKLDSRNAHYSFSLALFHRDRGDVLMKAGNTAAAADSYRQGLSVIGPLASTDPASWLKRRLSGELKLRVSQALKPQ